MQKILKIFLLNHKKCLFFKIIEIYCDLDELQTKI